MSVEMEFRIGDGVRMGFDIGSAAPAPAAPAGCLVGTVECITSTYGILADSGVLCGTAVVEE